MHVVRNVQCTVSQLHDLEIATYHKDPKYVLCSSRIAQIFALRETTPSLGKEGFYQYCKDL